MQVLSQVSINALKAVIWLAGKEGFQNIHILAKELNISFYFLTKCLQPLTERGILISYRGPNGGVALAKPAKEITIAEVVYAIEGADFFDSCLLGMPGCGTAKPCPVHDLWKEVKTDLKTKLESSSLAEINSFWLEKRLRLGKEE